ncbi:MAG: GNAT family N-acetyltransferase [Aquisalimonadaceae bacterium]
MHVEVLTALEDIPAPAWNALVGTDNPFLRHEFLAALERHGCVAAETGWQPHHLLLREGERLLAAVPAYLKSDSWGEFVFDWAWASAYERSGRAYYPKLVCAVPYTPASGPRLLLADGVNPATAAEALVAGGKIACERLDLSSMHWLFPEPIQAQALANAGLSTRVGCQFHWRNPGYRDFGDFLDSFSSKKRKNVKRERRQAREQGITFEIVPGDAVTAEDWQIFHRYYQRTFHAHGNLPTLTAEFFQDIGQRLRDRVLMVQGRDAAGLAATALLLRSDTTLYGRYWGCREERPGVHFESCFYQGINYCIEHGLSTFEPGAQGEHKIARGFLPTLTRSCHWIAEPEFRSAVDDFLRRESAMIMRYMDDLNSHSPYRDPPEATFDPIGADLTGTR